MSSEILNATIDGVLNTKLHIQNIPPHITDAHLRSVLGNAGQIKDICYFNKSKKQINNNFGNNKKIYNTALITFNTHEEALNVLKNIKTLIDTSSEERSIEAKFAVPNLNNNMFNKNNMNGNMSNNNNNFQNNFNNGNFGNNNNNMNNFNFYNNNSQNSFMNRNIRNKNPNNIMNMNNTQMNNMAMMNQNNFMLNNNYKNNKNMNDMLGDDTISPKSGNSNINNSGNTSPMFRQNNNVNMYQGNDSALDEHNENTEGLSLWEIYKDKNNNTFYYNNLTKHSQWNKPIHPNKLFQHNNNEKTKQNGPSGSNLFIFHIPSEWTDLDLFQHFCCFGNIISSKIQRDSTGRNSGFGFVSYDNVMSAHHAIQFMNGYFVNNKYLKVQLKKGEDTKEVQD